MSLEPGHHRHRAGEEEHRRPHRRATRKDPCLDQRKERGKGISRTLRPNPNSHGERANPNRSNKEKHLDPIGEEEKKRKGKTFGTLPPHLNRNQIRKRKEIKGKRICFGIKMNRAETLTLERILIPNRLNPRRKKRRNPNPRSPFRVNKRKKEIKRTEKTNRQNRIESKSATLTLDLDPNPTTG